MSPRKTPGAVVSEKKRAVKAFLKEKKEKWRSAADSEVEEEAKCEEEEVTTVRESRAERKMRVVKEAEWTEGKVWLTQVSLTAWLTSFRKEHVRQKHPFDFNECGMCK